MNSPSNELLVEVAKLCNWPSDKQFMILVGYIQRYASDREVFLGAIGQLWQSGLPEGFLASMLCLKIDVLQSEDTKGKTFADYVTELATTYLMPAAPLTPIAIEIPRWCMDNIVHAIDPAHYPDLHPKTGDRLYNTVIDFADDSKLSMTAWYTETGPVLDLTIRQDGGRIIASHPPIFDFTTLRSKPVRMVAKDKVYILKF